MNLDLLGKKIKLLRKENNQTLQELAQIISAHPSYIVKMEKGLRKPSLDKLLRISSSYALSLNDVRELLKLAGYEEGTGITLKNTINKDDLQREEVFSMIEQKNETEQGQVNVPNNLAVLYTDTAFITARPFGLTFDFGQTMGPTNNQNIVSRVGLSVEHAKAFLKVLSKKIVEAERLQKTDLQKQQEGSTSDN